MPQLYSFDQLREALSKETYQKTIVLEGMAKPPDRASDKHFQFALGTDCSNWAQIGKDDVLQIEYLGTSPCKDHTHALVRLYLDAERLDNIKGIGGLLVSVQKAAAAGCGDTTLPIAGRCPKPKCHWYGQCYEPGQCINYRNHSFTCNPLGTGTWTGPDASSGQCCDGDHYYPPASP